MSRTDERRAFVGSWQIQFFVDSVAGPIRRGRATYDPGPRAAVVGALQVRDTIVSAAVADHDRRDLVTATIQVDFAPVLGHQVSCFEEGAQLVEFRFRHRTVTIDFTPFAADCGLVASGQVYADSLIGAWEAPAFVGGGATGRFRMIRAQ